jgi:hypothetical protein
MIATPIQVTAVRSGSLPGGVDCYIGSDGGRYLSNRGMLRGIRPSTTGPEKGDFGRYLARLPNASTDLTSGPEVEILVPQPQGAWTPEEFAVRDEQIGELKIDVCQGRLFYHAERRRILLGMLLENVGLDAAIELVGVERWGEALDAAKAGGTKG